jgi:hypothetical protein
VADINLTVSASLAQFEAQLAKTGDITAEQAKNIARDLKSALSSAEKAAKDSAAATKRAMDDARKSATAASRSVDDVGDKFGKVGSSASKVAGVLDLLVPGLGEAARGVADVADGMEVASQGGSSLALGLGVVGAAMGAVALATAHYAEQLAIVDERNAQLAATATRTAESVARLKAVEEDLAVQLAVSTGALTEEEAALMRSTATVRAAFDEQVKAAEQRYEAARATRDNTQATYDEEKAARAALDAIRERRDTAVGTAAAVVGARQREQRATERASAAEREKAEADRAAAEAEREKEQATRDYLSAVAGYADGIRELQAAQLATASEEERILAAGAERIRQLDELAMKTSYLATTQAEAAAAEAEAEAARVAVRQDTAAKITALEMAASEERKKLADDERTQRAEADAAALEVQRAAIMEGVSLISDSLSASADNQAAVLEQLTSQLESNSENMTEADKKALKERIAAQREAAMLTFGLNKAAQLATATVNTATAVTAALASAPPPANLIAAGVAGAAGGAQIAAIAAQQPAFHSGGMVPDEVQARLVTGEAVLSRVGRNVIGDEQIRAANAGIAPPVQVVAINQYRHEVFRPFIRDHLRLGGDLSTAIRGTRMVGQREAL